MRSLLLPLFLALAIPAFCAPVHLRTNALEHPLAVDTPHPLLSWQSDAAQPDWLQSAYEILVATDARLLSPGKADAWDSGRVASAESVNIPYAGAPLRPQQRYVWAVRVWDRAGKVSTWSNSAFETGLQSEAAWKAQWIRRSDPAAEAEIAAIRWIWLPGTDSQHVSFNTPATFQYRLHLDAKPTAASLHVVAAGGVVARVNGHITGRHTDWNAFDYEEISDLLHAGDNEIELDCVSRKSGDTKAAVAASLHITGAGGKEQRIVTDGAWLARGNADGAWAPAQVVGPLSLHYGKGINREEEVPGPDRVVTDASLFRKEFTVAGKVESARLIITALGAYSASLNGHPVEPDSRLAPGWTDFHKRVQYQTYDVTALLNTGANALGVMLGGGWYSSPLTWAGERVTPGPNLLRAQLDLTLAGGTHQTVATDASWATAAAPVTSSEIYGGESFDARLEQRGWSHSGFHGTGWTQAVEAEPASPALAITAQPDQLIEVNIVLKPKALDPANSNHAAIYDMGQNMVGAVRLHVQGTRGTVVRLRFSERLNPDGSLYLDNLRNATATDTYILAGGAPETYTPSFTFHGFRYVEVSGVAAPTLATIQGLVFNSLPKQPTVRLTSSSATLNKMNELGAWGQRGNFVSIPTDCPQRDERLGWMGDAGAFWRTGTFNFDTQAFSHKFMLDVEDAQTPEGNFTDVSPNVLGPQTGAPGWGDAGVFVPYATWLQFGDTTVVEQAWPAMERWMTSILKSNPNYLRQKNLGNNYADWLAPDPNTPKDLIGTAYWALVAREMVEMANALHRPEDARKYQDVFDHVASAYRTAWVKDDGSVEGGTQTAYLATIFTGIAPESLRANMVDRLVENVHKHGDHLSTGFLGTPFLLPVLDRNGRSDLAFQLLLSESYPSWGYMVSKGATTWWERWNGDTGDPSMNSYNHYAFGSVMEWVYRRAAGIDTDPLGPGYRKLKVEPHFSPMLPRLHVEYDSDYGIIVSDWQQSSHTFTIAIPANTTAAVALPDGRTFQVGSGTHQYRIP